MQSKNPMVNEALPSAAFVRQVGAIREGGFCVRTAALSPDFDMPEDSSKAKISFIHRHRRLTATLSLAAVLNMMAVPVLGGMAEAAVTSTDTSTITVDSAHSDVSFIIKGGTTVGSSDATHWSGAILDVISGAGAGVVSGVQISSGGVENVSSAAIDSGATIEANGIQNVYTDGSAVGTTVKSGGVQNIGSGDPDDGTPSAAGGTVSGATIEGTQYVYSGGIVSGGTVESGGKQYIFADASAMGGIVNSDGVQNVGNGTADGATQSAAGGYVSGATILGTQNIYSAGSVNGGTVEDGGQQNVFSAGSVSGGIIGAGGIQNVGEGGILSNVELQAGGIQNITSATLNSTAFSGSAIAGTQNVKEGAIVSAITVNGTSAVQNISNGGSAVAITAVSGGVQAVRSDGSAISTILSSGGIQGVYEGATISDVELLSGGIQNINSGVTVSGGNFSGAIEGTQNILVGGVANAVSVGAGGVQTVDGGSASGTVVSASGTQSVLSGTVSGGNVLVSGSQNIMGGTVTGTTVSGTQIVSGGSAVDIVIGTSGIQDVYGGTVIDTSVGSGSQNIYSGVVSGTEIISAAGVQNVSGGEAIATTVTSGSQVIFSGGLATSTTVAADGTMTVSSGGEAVAAGIAGTATVASGGTITNMTLSSGGSATFNSSGGAILAGSANEIQSGGVLAGTVEMKDAATKLTLNTSDGSFTVSATIGGAGEIAVTDTNSATMSGVNSGFTGVINVGSGGDIIGAANYALGSGALVKAASGATVDYGAFSAVVRGLEGSGNQSATSGLTIAVNGTHVMDGNLTVDGALIIKGGTAVATPLLARAAIAPLAAGSITGVQIFDGAGNSADNVNVLPGGVMIVGSTPAAGSGAVFEISGASAGDAFNVSGDGAIIGGYGTLQGDVNITSNAVLAPGLGYVSNSGGGYTESTEMGTLTISGGDLTMNGGILQAKLDTNSGGALIHDQVVVSGGDATLTNTTISLNVNSGNIDSVVEAMRSGNGDIGAVVTTSGGTLNVDDPGNEVIFNNKLLGGTLDNTGHIIVAAADPTDTLGDQVNDNRVAVLGVMLSTGTLFKDAVWDGTAAEISQALDSLTGEVYAAAAAQAQGAQLSLGRQMLGRLAGFHNPGYAPPAGDEDGPHNLWFSFGASRGTIDGDDKIGTAEADTQRVDTALGYHHSMDNGWAVGAALQFGWGEVDVDDRWSQSDIDSLGFTLYGAKAIPTSLGDLRFTFGGTYTHYTVDVERWALLTTRQHLTGHQTGDGYGLFLEAAHRFQVAEGIESRVFLEPFLGLQYNALSMDSLTESGGNAALTMDADKMDNFSTDLGLRLVGDVSEAVSLNGSLSWAHNFGDVETWTKTRFVDGGNAFKIQGNSASEDELNIGLGATFHLSEGAGITVGYDGVIGDNSHSHGGHAVLDIRW